MRPTEHDELVLENRDEIDLAFSAVNSSIVDFGIGAASPHRHSQMQDMARKLIESVAGDSLELDSSETETLRAASRIAHENVTFAWGIAYCFQTMTRLLAEEVPPIMQASEVPQF